jgi:hypothetical protein
MQPLFLAIQALFVIPVLAAFHQIFLSQSAGFSHFAVK